jgi:hypothetical protein
MKSNKKINLGKEKVIERVINICFRVPTSQKLIMRILRNFSSKISFQFTISS